MDEENNSTNSLKCRKNLVDLRYVVNNVDNMQELSNSLPSFPPKVTVSGTDIRAKEVILVLMALCLLVCSICLFFKHWKKNYRDINQLPYYAYLYDKTPSTLGGRSVDLDIAPPCKPGGTNATAMAAAAMAAAMAERAAFNIYHRPSIFRKGDVATVKKAGPPSSSTIPSQPPDRRFTRRQSEFICKRPSHQIRRNSLFASTNVDHDLEADFNLGLHGNRQQRLSSIISDDDEDQDFSPPKEVEQPPRTSFGAQGNGTATSAATGASASILLFNETCNRVELAGAEIVTTV